MDKSTPCPATTQASAQAINASAEMAPLPQGLNILLMIADILGNKTVITNSHVMDMMTKELDIAHQRRKEYEEDWKLYRSILEKDATWKAPPPPEEEPNWLFVMKKAITFGHYDGRSSYLKPNMIKFANGQEWDWNNAPPAQEHNQKATEYMNKMQEVNQEMQNTEKTGLNPQIANLTAALNMATQAYTQFGRQMHLRG
jgi:hypothetical protein